MILIKFNIRIKGNFIKNYNIIFVVFYSLFNMNYLEEPGKRLEILRREIKKRNVIERIMSNCEPVITDTDDKYYNIQEGTYKVVLDYFGPCELFSIDNSEKIKHQPNYYISCLIKNKIESILPSTIKISDIEDNNDNYDIKLICEIKEENKEFYVQLFDKKELVYSMEIVNRLQSNKKYIITNFMETNYGNIIITSDGKRYWIGRKLMKILKDYFNVEDNQIICYYNNQFKNAKLILITGDDLTLNDNTKILYQSLKLEIDNKKFVFYINKSNFIDFNKEGLYHFMFMYNYRHSMLYAYEYLQDEYYCLTHKERKILLDNIDQKISRTFNDINNQYTYNYLTDNDKNLHSFIIKVNKNKTISVELENIEIPFETTLDITKFKSKDENGKSIFMIKYFEDAKMDSDEEIEEVIEDDNGEIPTD